jgi:hypothetical protein
MHRLRNIYEKEFRELKKGIDGQGRITAEDLLR